MRKLLRRGTSILLAVSVINFPSSFMGGTAISPVKTFASAQEETEATVYTDEDTKYTYTIYTDSESSVEKAEITGYAGAESDLVIPASVTKDGAVISVGKIAKGAFKENQSITSVTISEGINTIGYQAFYGCENIQRVQIPSTITTWGETSYDNSAFENCTGLTELNLAEDLSVLGQKAFAGCTSLASVRVPSGIETFNNAVFSGCTALVELELAEGIKQIGYQAFYGCSALEEVTIPSTVENWGMARANGIMGGAPYGMPFTGCTSLKKIVFSEGLKTLNNFKGISNCPLVTEVDVPSSVEDITSAFYGCTYLERINLHEGLKAIGDNAFSGCTSLEEVNIPNTVTSIGGSVFKECSSLESITFPPTVESFGYLPTFGCSSLKAIYMLNESIGWYQKFTLPNTAKIYCIEESDTYNKYLSGMQNDGLQAQLATFPSAGAAAEGYQAVWDDKEHDSVVLSGTQDGDEILYRIGEGNFQTEVPKVKEPGVYTVEICVKRAQEGVPAFSVSNLKAQVEIQKKTASIQLKDLKVNEKDNYTVTPEAFEGEGDIIYTYYKDEKLTQECTKPTTAGVYYVKAVVNETEHYTAAESNAAKIEIQKAVEQPVVTPVTKPSDKPSPKPSQKPDTSKKVTVKKVSLKKVKSPKKKTMQVQWKKVSGVTGYEIWIGTNKKITKGKKTYTVKKAKTVKKLIKKLKSKKKYYVKVRAYKVVNGKKHSGKFSSVKSVRIK